MVRIQLEELFKCLRGVGEWSACGFIRRVRRFESGPRYL